MLERVNSGHITSASCFEAHLGRIVRCAELYFTSRDEDSMRTLSKVPRAHTARTPCTRVPPRGTRCGLAWHSVAALGGGTRWGCLRGRWRLPVPAGLTPLPAPCPAPWQAHTLYDEGVELLAELDDELVRTTEAISAARKQRGLHQAEPSKAVRGGARTSHGGSSGRTSPPPAPAAQQAEERERRQAARRWSDPAAASSAAPDAAKGSGADGDEMTRDGDEMTAPEGAAGSTTGSAVAEAEGESASTDGLAGSNPFPPAAPARASPRALELDAHWQGTFTQQAVSTSQGWGVESFATLLCELCATIAKLQRQPYDHDDKAATAEALEQTLATCAGKLSSLAEQTA